MIHIYRLLIGKRSEKIGVPKYLAAGKAIHFATTFFLAKGFLIKLYHCLPVTFFSYMGYTTPDPSIYFAF